MGELLKSNTQVSIVSSRLQRDCDSSGFTFIELIVALFLISLLAAVVMPSFANFGDSKLRSEAREMASVLRHLNDSAAARKETFQLKFEFKKNEVSWKGPEGEKSRVFDDLAGVETLATGTVSEGEFIFFFDPLGAREGIKVHLSDGDRTLVVALNHLSGRVKIEAEGTGR